MLEDAIKKSSDGDDNCSGVIDIYDGDDGGDVTEGSRGKDGNARIRPSRG